MTRRRLHDLGQTAALAWADSAQDWRATSCLALALAAVLAPMLILFGLRFGVVEALSARLTRDPRVLELTPIGSGRFDAAWFAEARTWPEAAFVVPRTRSIAATMDLVRDGPIVTVELAPTDAGDPLLGAAVPAGDGEITLSGPAARKLGAKPGDALTGWIARTVEGRQERARARLVVAAVLPEAAYGRDAAFARLPLLDAAEDYRDGFAAAAFGAEGAARPDQPRIYAGFRLHGRTIRDVPILRDRLLAQRIEPATRAGEIETLVSLDRNLGFLFWTVATIGAGGFLLSLAASLWGAVERKRRHFATLRLIGFRTRALALYPAIQAGIVAAAGSALALAAYAGVAAAINARFAATLEGGETACRLLPEHAAAAFAATFATALAASALAGWRAAGVEPSEGLREI